MNESTQQNSPDKHIAAHACLCPNQDTRVGNCPVHSATARDAAFVNSWECPHCEQDDENCTCGEPIHLGWLEVRGQAIEIVVGLGDE